MTQPHSALPLTAEDMRRSFDAGFALAPDASARETTDFLAIQAGGGRYALRVGDLSGLVGHPTIVPLGSADPALLGIAGIRGQLLPVYRLAALIGAGRVDGESAWLAVCGTEEPVALAFAALDGHLRVPAADVYTPPDQPDHRFVREALRLGPDVRYVLDMPSILAAIRDRAGVVASGTGR